VKHAQTTIVKDLVLVGGGHSHVTVLKQFGMRPLPGVRLTLICRDVQTPYSGMLPGFIARHYTYDDVHIDLGPLSRFAGARIYHDEVVGLDLENRTLHCRHRPEVLYDLLSINIGWERLITRVLDTRDIRRIGIVGAGAGGVEMLLAMQFRLGQLLRQAGRTDDLEYHLFSGSQTILPTHNPRVQAKFRRVLIERSVHLHEGRQVIDVDKHGLRCADGQYHPLNEILWVTDATAPAWLGRAGLAVDERGFVLVDATLRSVSHADVFAAGDIASVVPHPREKAGVFAVRQGNPLARNLRRVLLGRVPKPFTPQSRWLALVSTGDRYAVASRGHWSVEGKWVWRWKDWIDRRFIRKFNELPEMESEEKVCPARRDRRTRSAKGTVYDCHALRWLRRQSRGDGASARAGAPSSN
jgi:selenide,water dikinase